jgi:hypothetical protein
VNFPGLDKLGDALGDVFCGLFLFSGQIVCRDNVTPVCWIVRVMQAVGDVDDLFPGI